MTSIEQLPSDGAKLHEIIINHAQSYVNKSESIQNIHASMEDYANEYRGDIHTTKDPEFETIQRMRIARQAILAALGRIIGDGIIENALTYSTSDGLDFEQMTKTIKPTYDNGMVHFLEEAVDQSLYAMTESDHSHNKLLQHAYDYEMQYATLLGNHTKKMGAMAIIPEPYMLFMATFVENYRNDVASFLVTHGITIQDQYGYLPDADTIVKATQETRSQWLGLAALSRIHIGTLYFGHERYKNILEFANQASNLPTWSTFWPVGIASAMGNNEVPFITCPVQSPLVNRMPKDPITASVKSPARCAGQIALYGSPEANENAVRLSGLVGGELTEAGDYSPAALLVDLGRTASKLSFDDPTFRQALIHAKEVRDEIMAENKNKTL